MHPFRFLCLAFIFLLTVHLQAQVVPYDLTVEYLTNPIGIDTQKPRLSWKSRSTDDTLRNVVQEAYQVLVASSPEKLDENIGDLWDSGRIVSDQSLNIEYAGKPFVSSQRCYWKVRTWYKSDDKTMEADSPMSYWIMGIMNPKDWKAQWIASAPEFRPDFETGNAKWIWAGHASDLNQAPAGSMYFRKIVHNPVEKTSQVILAVAAEGGEYRFYINGVLAARNWGHINIGRFVRLIDVTELMKPGDNLIAAEVINKDTGPTGLLASFQIKEKLENGNEKEHLVGMTNSTWSVGLKPVTAWNTAIDFKNSSWRPATEAGPIDCEPFGKIQRRFETKSPAFTKKFNIEKGVKEATLHITGVGFYEAFANGVKIGNKVLDPAQTRYDKRILYSTYNVTDMLRPGENKLDVLLGHGWYDVRSIAVWNFDNAPWRDFPRMIAQLEIVDEDGQKHFVLSNNSWEQVESPIINDCIRQGEASQAVTSPKSLGKAVVVDSPGGKLVAQAIPPSVVAEEWKPIKITEPTSDIYVVHTGQNMAGWVRVRFDKVPPGTKIEFRYGERLDETGRVDMKPIHNHYRQHFPYEPGLKKMFQVDSFITGEKQENIYEPRFMYHGFQYVEITGLSSPPSVDQVTVCAVHNDFRSAGHFLCSNELFNAFQKAILWSYRSNFVNGVPTDCPHREKNGWTGDAHLACELAQYNFENTACYEKWVYDILDEQQPNGNLPGIVPTSGWGYKWGNGPAWDSAICIVPWYLYHYKGDQRILEEAYHGMKKYVDYLTSMEKENGLLYYGLGDWHPPTTATEPVVTSSVFYYLDARIVAETAALLGKPDDAEKYANLAETVRKRYFKELYREDGTIGKGTQTAQSFAYYFGLLPEKGQEKHLILDRLYEAVGRADNHLDVGILGAKSLFHVLSRSGRTDLALTILNQKTPPGYGSWIERNATTFWENWKDGASRNHVMFGDISTWFYQVLGGLRLHDTNKISNPPGFQSFLIDPVFPNGIDWVDLEHDSPYGPIKIHWTRKEKKIVLDLSIPVNTTATVVPLSAKPLGSGKYTFVLDATEKKSMTGPPLAFEGTEASTCFVHPGILHSQKSLDTMKHQVALGMEPWKSAFVKFQQDECASDNYQMRGPFETVSRRPRIDSGKADTDFKAAYYNAIMWAITSKSSHSIKSMEIFDAYAASFHGYSTTDRDVELTASLGPFLLINAAEIIRYSNAGWTEDKIEVFEKFLITKVLPKIRNFATFANGNWDTGCIKTIFAIGIFCNDVEIFSHGIDYFFNGKGNGRLVHYIINEAGQCQESGRDQQHVQLGISHLAEAAEVAFHQGIDLYGAADNGILRGFEYTAKYCLGNSVPFSPYIDKTGKYPQDTISESGRGGLRPIYEMVWNHYERRKGIDAPYTKRAAEKIRPEGGMSNADHPGYGTLLFTILEFQHTSNK